MLFYKANVAGMINMLGTSWHLLDCNFKNNHIAFNTLIYNMAY